MLSSTLTTSIHTFMYLLIHLSMYLSIDPSMYQPFDFYKQAVENLPIVCVDVICKRSDGKMLLFYRRDKPVAHLWWW